MPTSRSIRELSESAFHQGLRGCEARQGILAKIEALPFNTVAAINGLCLGGGTELSLACKFRIATTARRPRSVFPRSSSASFPAGAAAFALPRLIGIQEALKLITAGRITRRRRPYLLGIVDELVAPAKLIARAEQVALTGDVKRAEGSKSFKDAASENNSLGRKILASQALPLVKSQSRVSWLRTRAPR